MTTERADPAWVSAFRSRASAAPPAPSPAIDADDLDTLVTRLAPLLPREAADASDFRSRGAVDASGAGWIVDELPFGGSVIEGYHSRLTAVLVNGAVVSMAMDGEWGGVLTPLSIAGPPEAVSAVVALLAAR